MFVCARGAHSLVWTAVSFDWFCAIRNTATCELHKLCPQIKSSFPETFKGYFRQRS